jgi:hypothetical protein
MEACCEIVVQDLIVCITTETVVSALRWSVALQRYETSCSSKPTHPNSLIAV